MNMPPPAPRRQKNIRNLSCDGYQREDGLWDIEARILDTKTSSDREPYSDFRLSGEVTHDMALRLTFDDDMVVRDIAVAMPSAPDVPCHGVAPGFNRLIGKKIGAGWRRAVQECVGGAKGYTQLHDLLLSAATVAIQIATKWPERPQAGPSADPDCRTERPHFVDACKAWASDGEIVAALYPHSIQKTD